MVRVHVRPPSPFFFQVGSTGSGRLFGNWPRVRLLHRRACEGKKQTSIKQREPGTLGTDVPGVPSQGHGTGFVRSPVRPGAGNLAPRLYGRMADALAAAGEEGRGKLRKATGRRMRSLIRGCPNGATRMVEDHSPA